MEGPREIGMIAEKGRSDHDETTTPEPEPDFKAKVAVAAIKARRGWPSWPDDRPHPPPQHWPPARALGISRGSVYYLPQSTSAADLALMRRIDELHLDHAFAGSRMLQGLLKTEGQ